MFVDQLLDDRQRPARLGLRFRQLACLQEELRQAVVAEGQLLPEVGDPGVLVDEPPEEGEHLTILGLGLGQLAPPRQSARRAGSGSNARRTRISETPGWSSASFWYKTQRVAIRGFGLGRLALPAQPLGPLDVQVDVPEPDETPYTAGSSSASFW